MECTWVDTTSATQDKGVQSKKFYKRAGSYIINLICDEDIYERDLWSTGQLGDHSLWHYVRSVENTSQKLLFIVQMKVIL